MRKYQVVMFGDIACKEADTFKTTLKGKFAELHIDGNFLAFLSGDESSLLDATAPVVGVYFAFTSIYDKTVPGLSEVLSDGYVVIPVVRDLKNFSNFVPEVLCGSNGLQHRRDDTAMQDLCGAVLENLSLLRRSRRVFISYRRAESQAVAIQLYEELDRRTFDVFLDTLAIRPGEPFQEVLWHRLADTDVMVLLDTPNFLTSRWSEDELAHANNTSIQVLQVIWPGHEQQAEAAFSTSFTLAASDFETHGQTNGPDARLKNAVIDQIALETESLRARALAARHAFLVQEMFREAESVGGRFVAHLGQFLEFIGPEDRKAIMVPTVGVPDAVRYQEIEEHLSEEESKELILVFDERGVRDRWVKHLAWLDLKMSVRSLPIRDVRSWMTERFKK